MHNFAVERIISILFIESKKTSPISSSFFAALHYPVLHRNYNLWTKQSIYLFIYEFLPRIVSSVLIGLLSMRVLPSLRNTYNGNLAISSKRLSSHSDQQVKTFKNRYLKNHKRFCNSFFVVLLLILYFLSSFSVGIQSAACHLEKVGSEYQVRM